MKRVFYFIIGWLCVLPLYAQEEKIEKIDSYLDLLENNQQGIASVAISRGGELIYQKKIGYSAMPAEIREREDLKGRIGSITKMVTATLIFQLAEEGKIDLQETLNTYFPEVPNSEKIKISHMLSHSSGMGDMIVKDETSVDWLLEPVDMQDILEVIIRQGVTFEPGEDTRYSNSAYYLLGKIVEKKCGKPYEEVVQERIVTPLGLKNTVANVASGSSVLPSYIMNYDTREWQETKDFYFPNIVGVGDMLSTPEELVIFIEALFNGQLISAPSLQQMLPEQGKFFGKGIMLVPFYDKLFYGHGGSTFGCYSLVAIRPEEEVVFSVIMNGQETSLNDMMIGLLSIWYDSPFEFPVFTDKNKVFNKSLYPSFEGIYGAEDFPYKIKIFQENEELYLQIIGQPAFNMEQLDDHLFAKKAFNVKIEFPEEGKMVFIQAQRFVLEKEQN